MIDLSVDQDAARLTLMKNAEAPLLSAEVDDAGSILGLFDGRQPSQRPRSIILRAACETENKQDEAMIALTRLHAKSFVGAMLRVRDPDDKASLMLGGSEADNVTLRVNPEDGKLDFLEGSGQISERNRR